MVPVKTLGYPHQDEKTPGALLQLRIAPWINMCRIAGRLGSGNASCQGATLEIPVLLLRGTNQLPLPGGGTVRGG